ncbi:MAG: glycosyltransferase family 9 protein [Leptotrichiaceae bacterium]|nr:glycosyltransferase family 9 protein [Leptotrichiaceae bacterium]
MNIWCEKGAKISQKTREKLKKFNPLDIKKIAIIRHAALGDMIITRAFLIELKNCFPNAEITLSLVDKYLYGKPSDLYNREHIFYRKKGFFQKVKNIKELGKQDIIFDFASTSASRLLTFFTGAFLKIGFPYRGFDQNFLYDISILRSDFHFEGDIMLDTLKIFGHKPKYPLDYELPQCSSFEKRIVYFFGASTETKQYPREMYYELINRLSDSYKDYKHVLLEGKSINEKFEDIPKDLLDKTNVSIQNTLDLSELIEYLSKSRLCVSPDTGVRNVAIATHTPTVGIFYSTVPYRYWPRYENGHDAAFVRNGEIPSVKVVEEVIVSNLSTNIVRG